MTIKRRISNMMLVLLVISLIMPSFPGKAKAAVLSDVEGSWAAKTLTEWLSKGWLHGYPDGSAKPDNAVTRAEFVTLSNNALGFIEKTVISYSDVKFGSWQYDQIAKAVKAGYIHGYENGTMRPDNKVSREEVAVMVAAAFQLDLTQEGESSFTDADKVSSWAEKSVDALVAKGIVNGYPDGTFKPKASITRAEAVVILDNAVKANMSVETYSKAGTFGPATGIETIAGDITIRSGGVTLQNTVITGNLLLAESIDEGEVYLNNVTVKGTTTIRGGGANSVHLLDTVLVTLTVDKKTGDIRIVAEGMTTVNQVILKSGAKLESNTTSGAGFSTVTLSDQVPAGAIVTLLGEFHIVDINATAVIVHIPSGLIDILNASDNSSGSSLIIAKDARIVELVLNAVLKVLGLGSIEKAILSDNAKGSTFEKQPLEIEGSSATTSISGGGGGTSQNGGGTTQTGPLTIDTTSPSNGQIGIPYSTFFTSTGGTGARTYTVTAGTLPVGLSLSTIGVLTGTPTAEGVSTFTLMVTDSATATSSHAFTLVIDPQSAGLDAINAATSAEAVQALLGIPDNQAKLDLSMNNYYLLPSLSRFALASAVFNGGWDYSSAEEIKEVFDHVAAIQIVIMDMNNAATTDKVLQLLVASQNQLNVMLSPGSLYDSLTAKDREALAALMMNKRPYSTTTEIKTAFEAGLKAQSLVVAINAAANAESVKTLLETKYTDLGLKMEKYYLLSPASQASVATMVYNSGVDYFTATDIKLAFDAEVTVQPIVASVNAITSFNASIYDSIFSAYHAQIGVTMDYYSGLTDPLKSKVTKAIFDRRPYTTSAALKDVFNKEVAIQTLIQYMNNPGITADEVLQLLDASQQLIGVNLSTGSLYSTLTDTEKIAVAAAMIGRGPFDSAAAIKAAFEAEVLVATSSH